MGAAPHRPADPDGFTVEMAEHLLPDSVRYELHGGRIVVMSPAKQWHSRAQHRLMALLERQGRIAGIKVGLKIAARDTRVLDVAAFHDEIDVDEAYFSADQIALAVEVVSPRSREDDYVDKPALYAQLGIDQFWRVDRDTRGIIHVAMYELDSGGQAYDLTGTVTLDQLDAEQPR